MRELYRFLLIAFGFLLYAVAVNAQNSKSYGIGTDVPNPRAVLELNVVNPSTYPQGLLLPRLTTTQRNALSTAITTLAGMTVFDTQDNQFYVWNGSSWNSTTAIPTSITAIGGINISSVGQNFTVDGSNFLQLNALFSGDVNGIYNTLQINSIQNIPVSISGITAGQYLYFDGASITGVTFTPTTPASITGINGIMINQNGQGFTIDGINFTSSSTTGFGDVSGSFAAGFTVTGLKGAPINTSTIPANSLLQFDGSSIVGFNPAQNQSTITGTNGILVNQSGQGFTIDGINFTSSSTTGFGDVSGSFASGFTVTGLKGAPINTSTIPANSLLQFDGSSIVGFNPAQNQSTITGTNGILVNQSGQGFTIDGINFTSSSTTGFGDVSGSFATGFTVTGLKGAPINTSTIPANSLLQFDGSSIVGFNPAQNQSTITGTNGISVNQNGQAFTIDGLGFVTSLVGGNNISLNQSGGVYTISGTGSSQWITTTSGIYTNSFVGIGTSNPLSLLNITNGSVRVDDGSFTGSALNTNSLEYVQYFAIKTQSYAGLGTGSGGNVMLFDANNNVGIGNLTSANEQLTVMGNSSVSGIGYFGTIVGNNLAGATGSIITVDGFGQLGIGTFPTGLSGSGTSNGVAYFSSANTITSDGTSFNYNPVNRMLTIGNLALYTTSVAGNNNFFVGSTAGNTLMSGTDNNFIGYQAGYNNTTGKSNNFFGKQAGYSNTIGQFNNFLGEGTGQSNDAGSNNNFMGYQAGNTNTSGSNNNFFGIGAGVANVLGTNNNFFGQYAGSNNTDGNNNIFIGPSSGQNNTTGQNNIALGNNSGFDSNSYSNAVAIGANATVGGNNMMALGGALGSGSEVNVGVGTGTPTNTFHVAGGARIESLSVLGTGAIVTVDGLGNLGVGAMPSGSSQWTDDTYGVTYGQNIGIGIASDPYTKIYANSDVSASGTGVYNGLYANITNTNAGYNDNLYAISAYASGGGNDVVYGAYIRGVGTANDNVYGGYFSASGGINNYGLVVPSGNVGIGTATPTHLFEIALGNASLYTDDYYALTGKYLILNNVNSGEATGFIMRGFATSSWGMYADPGSDLLVIGNLDFFTNNLTLSPDGGVAIGISTGSSSTNVNTDLTTINSTQVTLTNFNNSGGGGMLTVDGLGNLGVGAMSSGSSQWTTSGSDIYYNTGNIGIGTSTPGTNFQIVGSLNTDTKLSIRSMGSTSPTGISKLMLGANGYGSSYYGEPLGRIEFEGYHSGYASWYSTAYIEARATEYYFSTNGTGSQLSFFTTQIGSLTPVERFSINDDGTLTVGNLSGAAGSIVTVDGTGTLGIGTLPSGTSQWIDDVTPGISYSGGNVAIGLPSSSPDAALDVYSNVPIPNPAAYLGIRSVVTLTGSGNGSTATALSATAINTSTDAVVALTANAIGGNYNIAAMFSATGGVNNYGLAVTDGNVAIGSIGTSNSLFAIGSDIPADATGLAYAMARVNYNLNSNVTPGVNSFSLLDVSGNNGGVFDFNAPVTGLAVDVSNIYGNSQPVYAAVFNGGNVGIGTTTPLNSLDVSGGMVIGSNYAGSYNAPSNGLLVQGYVGIGTSNPQSDLHIEDLSGIDTRLTINSDALNSSNVTTGVSRLLLSAINSYYIHTMANDVLGSIEFAGSRGKGASFSSSYIQSKATTNFDNSGNVGSDLSFYTTLPAGNSSAPYERLRINDDGTLNILAPVYTTTGGYMYVNPATGDVTLNTPSGVSQWLDNSPSIYFNTGNVGIGTNTPAYPLDIETSSLVTLAYFGNTVGGNSDIVIESVGGSSAVNLSNQGSGIWSLIGNSLGDNAFALQKDGVTYMAVSAGGDFSFTDQYTNNLINLGQNSVISIGQATGSSATSINTDNTTINSTQIQLTNFTNGGAGGALVVDGAGNIGVGSGSGYTSANLTLPLYDSAGSLAISQASGSTDGYLSSGDYTTFSNYGTSITTLQSQVSGITPTTISASNGNNINLTGGAGAYTIDLATIGGDISGDYTNLIVNKIQTYPIVLSAPIAGDVLSFDGTNFVNAPGSSGGSSQWVTTGSDVYYTTGSVGIGNSTPASLFSVGSANGFQVDVSGNIVQLNGATVSFPGANTFGFLVNDGSGNLTWAPAGSVTGAGIGSSPAGTFPLVTYQNSSTINPASASAGVGIDWNSTSKSLVLNGNHILLRVDGDINHSLVDDATMDGPILYGYGGGAFGVSQGSPVGYALYWKDKGGYPFNAGDAQIAINNNNFNDVTATLDVNGEVRIRSLPTTVVGTTMVVADALGNLGSAALPSGTSQWTISGSNLQPIANNDINISSTSGVYRIGDLEVLRSNGANNSIMLGGAGSDVVTGQYNNYIGYQAGQNATSAGAHDNNFMGYQAGQSTTGESNNFIGRQAGQFNTTGYFNNFIGIYAGQSNTSGIENNFIGVNAGANNAGGSYNNFIGRNAGMNSANSLYNNFIGYHAGSSSTGDYNNFLGYNAGNSNNGYYNVAIGYGADIAAGGYSRAIAIGYNATVGGNDMMALGGTGVNAIKVGIGTGVPAATLHVVGGARIANLSVLGAGAIVTVDGLGNLGVGTMSSSGGLSGNGSVGGLAYYTGANTLTSNGANLGWDGTTLTVNGIRMFVGGINNFVVGNNSSTSGAFNNIFGSYAGSVNAGGQNNFFGSYAGQANTSGQFNNFIGNNTGYSNTTGSYNNFVGYLAGYSNYIGVRNDFMGYRAGFNNYDGNYNVAVGFQSGPGSGSLTNTIAIGKNATPVNSNTVALGGTGTDAVSVGIGTGAPTATLHVVGGARIENLSVLGAGAIVTVDGLGNLGVGALSTGGITVASPAAVNSLTGLAYYSGANTISFAGSALKWDNINSRLSIGATPNINGQLKLSVASDQGDANILLYNVANSNNYGYLVLGRGKGNLSATTAVQTNDQLGIVGFGGYDGSGILTNGPQATIEAVAAENYTGSANGARLAFRTTSLGGINATIRMSIEANGQVAIGVPATISSNAALQVNSGGNRGFLLPQITTAQQTALTSSLTGIDAGMIFYNTSLSNVVQWDGTSWNNGGSNNSGGGSSYWDMFGTSVTGALTTMTGGFRIGTQNNYPFSIAVNGFGKMYFGTIGGISVGMNNATTPSTMQVNADLGLGDGTGSTSEEGVITIWLKNNSGSGVTKGTILIVDGSVDNSFTTTSTQGSNQVAGIAYENIAPGAQGRVAIKGVMKVFVNGTSVRGQHVITSTTSGSADATAVPTAGTSIGIWLESASGSARVLLK